MKLSVMAHHPRTQRLGPSSVAHEVHIFTGEEKEAREIIKQMREAKDKLSKISYSDWKPEDVIVICGYTVWVYADFYLKVCE